MNKLFAALRYMQSIKFNALDSMTIIVMLVVLELISMTRAQ